MAMPSVILRYDSSFYQSKIDAFESLNARLKEHLETLEGLKQQIPDFWEDESTARYIEVISRNISRVRQASEDVSGLKMQYQKIIDSQTRTGAAIDETVEEAWNVINKNIEMGSKVLSVLKYI